MNKPEMHRRYPAMLRPPWLLALLLMLSEAAWSQLWSQSQPTAEDEPVAVNWHVEVLLFAHRLGDIAWRAQEQLQDFRSLPVMPAVLTPAAEQTIFSTIDSSDDSAEPFASAAMAAAWHDMQGKYELLAYYHWSQLTGIGRRWRIHGEQALPQPFAVQESEPVAQAADATTDAEVITDADRAAKSVIMPQPQYVLDGSLKINTGDVGVADLNIRERSAVLYYRSDLAVGDSDRDETSAYRVRKLQQRRRIQAGRVEYFDSAGLAALVLISELAEAEDAAATEPQAVTRQ